MVASPEVNVEHHALDAARARDGMRTPPSPALQTQALRHPPQPYHRGVQPPSMPLTLYYAPRSSASPITWALA